MKIIKLLNNPTVAMIIAIVAWNTAIRLIVECTPPGTQMWEAIFSGIAMGIALPFTRIYCQQNVDVEARRP